MPAVFALTEQRRKAAHVYGLTNRDSARAVRSDCGKLYDTVLAAGSERNRLPVKNLVMHKFIIIQDQILVLDGIKLYKSIESF